MKNGEVVRSDLKETKPQSEVGYKNIKPVKEVSIKELNDAVKTEFDKASEKSEIKNHNSEAEKKGVSEEDRIKIKEETSWSDVIIDHIDNMEQYELYKNADLHEVEVNGRKCLVKNIDMDYVDPKTGMTNRERMEKGRAPIDSKTGEKIELHHMGQDFNGPFVELCENSEHGDGNHSVLHTKSGESWRKDPEKNDQYNNVDRPNHWKDRAREA